MGEQPTAWQRLAGQGMYPVEYAGWLLNPLRYLVAPPYRIADRLQISSTDRVLEIGCGPGFFSPTIARRLAAGHLTLFDAQDAMLKRASQRMEQHGLVNVSCICGNAERLPFANETFDAAFMVAVLGEVHDRIAAMNEIARVLLPHGCLSATEVAGDPDCVKPAELDTLAARAGLQRDECWPGFLVNTYNYRKLPPTTSHPFSLHQSS